MQEQLACLFAITVLAFGFKMFITKVVWTSITAILHIQLLILMHRIRAYYIVAYLYYFGTMKS